MTSQNIMNLDKLLQLYNLDDDLTNLHSKVREGRDVMVFSAGEGEKIHISSHLDKFVLFVAKDSFRAASLLNKIQRLLRRKGRVSACQRGDTFIPQDLSKDDTFPAH